MSGVTGAVIGSAVVGAGASIYAANKSASAMRDSTSQAISAQQDAQARAETLTAPQRQLGYGAVGKLGNLFGIGPDGQPTGAAPDYSGFNNSPGFQFALGLGQQAVNKNAAAQGNLYSPTTMSKLSEYTTGFASQHYNDYVKQLQDMAGLGGSAASQVAGSATTTGEGVAQSLTNQGMVNASGVQQSGGAIAGLARNPMLLNALSQGRQLNEFTPTAQQVPTPQDYSSNYQLTPFTPTVQPVPTYSSNVPY